MSSIPYHLCIISVYTVLSAVVLKVGIMSEHSVLRQHEIKDFVISDWCIYEGRVLASFSPNNH